MFGLLEGEEAVELIIQNIDSNWISLFSVPMFPCLEL